MTIRETIISVFNQLWADKRSDAPPVLTDDVVLLESGLDSMDFAVMVAELDDQLGFDPFTLSDDSYYPRTMGEFVAFYEKFADA
jgi:acyl carrier protein